jgi:hypothetical protein
VYLRLLICSAIVRGLAIAAATSAMAQPADAQSFFQQLFGSAPSTPAPVTPRAATSQKSYSSRLAEGFKSSSRVSRYQSTRDDAEAYKRDPGYGGSYRTVCVRMCDGYYWPVSSNVSSARFQADERRCDANCLGDAKLFVLGKSSDNIKDMVSLDGQVYGKMKTAFLYRRRLVQGCGCKPAPWSAAETFRHGQYEAVIAQKKAKEEALRLRALTEAAQPDQISFLIAATDTKALPKTEVLAPVAVAGVETVVALDADVIVAIDQPEAAPDDVFHMMPGLTDPGSITVSVAEEPHTPVDPDGLMEAVAEAATWMTPQEIDHAIAANLMPLERQSSAKAGSKKLRKSASEAVAKPKPEKPQTSWFSAAPSAYRWPGD